MRLFGKLFRKKKLAGHDEASQEAAVLAQIKKWEENERLNSAGAILSPVGRVGPPSTLICAAGDAPVEQKDGDNVPLEKQQDSTDNILLEIWGKEEEAGHGNSMIRDIVSEVEEVDAEQLLDDLVSLSRDLSSWAKK